jgi:hypothetical protein
VRHDGSGADSKASKAPSATLEGRKFSITTIGGWPWLVLFASDSSASIAKGEYDGFSNQEEMDFIALPLSFIDSFGVSAHWSGGKPCAARRMLSIKLIILRRKLAA